MTKPLTYPPPFQDAQTLAAHLCISETTVDVWVKNGVLPGPTVSEGKRLWQWTKVVRHLEARRDDVQASSEAQVERITHATRQASSSKN